MQKHVIFLVHGMGDFEAGWAGDAIALLKRAYSEYKISDFIDFDDRFVFKEIEYNHIFEERRKAWKEEAEAINGILISNGFTESAATKLLSLANGATGDSFFKTHILDVIFYRFMPQIADQVKRFVQKSILEVTEEGDFASPPIWSVVAHSLGTAVVNETLHAMFTHPVSNTLLSHTRKPEVIAMVANVSRVLWNDGSIYDRSTVFPHPDRVMGMCTYYLNFQHPLDPFPRIKSFHPPKPPWRNDMNRDNYILKKIGRTDITDWNVHGFTHYLAHPAVQAAIFRALLFKGAVKDDEIEVQMEAYRQLQIDKVEEVATELAKVKTADVDTEDWESISEMIALFRALVLAKGKVN